jgi:hypothetical protein
MTTIPLGIAGGIVGLALLNAVGTVLAWLGLGSLHQPFDMISMLGFLILMGTVVNNPILIVDRAMQNMKAAGSAPIDAVREAVAAPDCDVDADDDLRTLAARVYSGRRNRTLSRRRCNRTLRHSRRSHRVAHDVAGIDDLGTHLERKAQSTLGNDADSLIFTAVYSKQLPRRKVSCDPPLSLTVNRS